MHKVVLSAQGGAGDPMVIDCAAGKQKAAEPRATDNPDDAQRLREDD
jgi:hypothetical protein